MPELLKSYNKSVVWGSFLFYTIPNLQKSCKKYYTTRKSHMLFTQIHQFLIVYSICFIVFFFCILLSSFHLSISLSLCVCLCFFPEPFESKLETFSYWAFTTKYLCIFPRINRSKLSKPETLTSVQCFYLTHCLNSNFTNCFNIIL